MDLKKEREPAKSFLRRAEKLKMSCEVLDCGNRGSPSPGEEHYELFWDGCPWCQKIVRAIALELETTVQKFGIQRQFLKEVHQETRGSGKVKDLGMSLWERHLLEILD